MNSCKSKVYIVLAVFSILFISSCQQKSKEKNISISGAFALYPLTVKWAEEYQKLNPEVTIDVSAGGAGKGMTDVLSGMVDLAMFSRTISPEEISNGAWAIAVSRDAVVPTVNSSNPYLKTLLKQGITPVQFADIYVNNKIIGWNQLIRSAKSERINIYTRSDACGAAEMWAEFIGSNQESLSGTGVFGDPGIADAVKNDKLGMGYNNIIFAYDTKNRKAFDGISVIPIDINSNGQIDEDEKIYSTLDEIMNAIAEDKYPSPPARNLFLISKGEPTKKITLDFLNWILTDGQKYVHEAGFVQLSDQLIRTQKLKISK